jgi:predicted DNA-binding transcriptional regulator YafY
MFEATGTSMYHPTTRVLTVLELLQTYGRLGAAELAERLEVTQRSVRRYITMLQELGIPVESERGRYGGYRLRPGYKLPPLMFTNNEALVVTLGLLNVQRLGLTADEPAIEGALAKIGRVLPQSVQQQIRSVQESTILDDVANEHRTPADTVIKLGQAVQDSRRVWVRYGSPYGGETSRIIDPYGMILRDGLWYVAGWCHLREDLRVFRLDRIKRHRTLSGTFSRPADFDARKTVASMLEERLSDPEVEILLDTTMNEARHWASIVSAALEETAEGVLFRCNPGSMSWLAFHIASMPWPVTVRKPASLMEELKRLAQRISEIDYAPDAPAKEAVLDRG